MTDTLTRVTDEFRRMDDELAAAVVLPAVDSVIRRAGTATRTSTAAAAAVLTVGALGGITAVAQAGPSGNVAAELPAPGVALQPAPSSEPLVTSDATDPGPAVDSGVPRQRARVAPPPAAAPVVEPTPEPPPAVVDPPKDDDTEGKQDPTRSPRPPKPSTSAPKTTPKTTPPDTPTTEPAPTTSASGTTGSTGSTTPSA